MSEAERASAEYRSAYGYRTEDDGVPPPLKIHAHDGPNNTFSAIRIINETAGINLLWVGLWRGHPDCVPSESV